MACGIKVSGISRVKSSNPTKEMGCLLYGFSGWPVDLPVSSHAGKKHQGRCESGTSGKLAIFEIPRASNLQEESQKSVLD